MILAVDPPGDEAAPLPNQPHLPGLSESTRGTGAALTDPITFLSGWTKRVWAVSQQQRFVYQSGTRLQYRVSLLAPVLLPTVQARRKDPTGIVSGYGGMRVRASHCRTAYSRDTSPFRLR